MSPSRSKPIGPPAAASGELPPRPHFQVVAADTSFPLDIEGAVETPIPTPEEPHILRQVVDSEQVFLEVRIASTRRGCPPIRYAVSGPRFRWRGI